MTARSSAALAYAQHKGNVAAAQATLVSIDSALADTARMGGSESGNRDKRAPRLALELAALAGEWGVVTVLARELEARRRERIAPEVTSLDDERARRGKTPSA